MGTDEFTSNHSRPQAESEHSMLNPTDYKSLLAQVVQLVEDAGLLLITEWQRPEGPRGSGDKADVDVEIESLLKPRLLQLLDCDFWGEETGHRWPDRPLRTAPEHRNRLEQLRLLGGATGRVRHGLFIHLGRQRPTRGPVEGFLRRMPGGCRTRSHSGQEACLRGAWRHSWVGCMRTDWRDGQHRRRPSGSRLAQLLSHRQWLSGGQGLVK